MWVRYSATTHNTREEVRYDKAVNPVVRWCIKRKIKRELKRRGWDRKERNLMLKALEGLAKLSFVKSGWLTLLGSWGAILDATAVPFMCAIHHPIAGVPCPDSPAQAALLGLVGVIGVGLGRRK